MFLFPRSAGSDSKIAILISSDRRSLPAADQSFDGTNRPFLVPFHTLGSTKILRTLLESR